MRIHQNRGSGGFRALAKFTFQGLSISEAIWISVSKLEAGKAHISADRVLVCPHWSIFSHCRGLLAYLKTLQTEILWDHSVNTIPLFCQEDDLELARLTPKTKQTFFLKSPEPGSTMTISLMGGNMTCIWKVRSQCDAGIISHSPQTQPQWIYYYYLYIEMKGKLGLVRLNHVWKSAAGGSK